MHTWRKCVVWFIFIPVCSYYILKASNDQQITWYFNNEERSYNLKTGLDINVNDVNVNKIRYIYDFPGKMFSITHICVAFILCTNIQL